MRLTPNYILLLSLTFGGGLRAAGDDKPATAVDPKHPENLKQGLDLFKREIRTVFATRCLRCHGGEETEGEFNIVTRKALLTGGRTGAVIVPGKPDESVLMNLIRHEDEPFMPQDGDKLQASEIAAIAKWIELGAPYDKPLVGDDAVGGDWTERTVPEDAKQFWSFQPLADVATPSVLDPKWPRTDIDRFILHELEERGIEPNPIAERETLVRRAYFDLIGLPPEPEELQAALDDDSADWYGTMIDRLLDSKHFGERWGRHWLDVARFGESHGFEQDYDRPHAYHYRDFVIKAFNADMPFDQFVQWQIAGDEFEPGNPLAMMATGFLGAGVFPTQLTEKEFESARYDELDDMVGTLGTSMLGLTIGCARCHDHKFDPIPAADYYRMVSTFRTAIRSEIEIDLDPAGTSESLKSWAAEHEPLVAELKRFEDEELPKRFDQWLASRPDKPVAPADWMILDLTEYRSEGGATLTKLEDGSLLASGTNPNHDTYVFVTETGLTKLKSVRLEALAHESFTRNGPGRAGNGNFGLGNFKVTAAPLDDSSKPVDVKLVNPRVTFQQNGANLSIAASIDGNDNTGWAVDPQFGKDHAAAFDFAEPVGFESGTRLTFTMTFKVNGLHNIGRPRLSISTEPGPDFAAPSQRQNVIELGRLIGDGKLTDAQRTRVTRWYRVGDDEWTKRNQAVQNHVASKPKPKLTTVMVTSEGFKPMKHHADGRGFPHFYKESHFLRRGDADQKVKPAESSFLQVLMPAADAATAWRDDVPDGSRTSFRRHSLAGWITDTDHGAGHLLARVIVNRLWQHHIGRGIVTTPNDFGAQGQRPTHPELLDWLASKLIEGGWRLKPLHKLIMTSAVYQQTTDHNEFRNRLDPDNRWFWRREPRRLEAEVIRDAMLTVGERLDRTQFGKGTLDPNQRRRSVYFFVKRSKLIPMMQIFDAPEPLVSVGERPATTIASQALMFMNSPQVRDYARGFAGRVTKVTDDSSAAIRLVYQIALTRSPDETELADGIAFVEGQSKSYDDESKPNARQLALTDFCQVLMSSNEFVFAD